MTRVKTGPVTTKRHKKIIKLAKWYKWWRSKLFKLAKNAVMKAWLNAYRDRRLKKRTFRRLWIVRLSSCLRERWIRYSEFMNKFSNSKIFLNRKILSELSTNHPVVIEKIIEKIQ